MKKFLLLLSLTLAIYSCSNDSKQINSEPNNSLKEFKGKYFSGESANTTISKLDELRQLVIKGHRMDSLARIYSEDPGTVNYGGQYDSITRGAMVSEFDSVVFSLNPGDISEIFETKYGFHFVQVLSRYNEYRSARHILLIPKK